MKDDKIFVGIDVGGTSVKIGLFSTKVRLLDKWEIKTVVSNDCMPLLERIVDSIRGKIDTYRIEGIGIGVPGPVNADSVCFGCVNLGWGVEDAATKMKKILPHVTNVKVLNDANAACLGELKSGAGKGYESAFMLTLGTGIGGGYAIADDVLRGTHGAAGEVGHIIVNPSETLSCNCGRQGCLEQYCSAKGVARMAKEMLAKEPCDTKLNAIKDFTSKEICDFAKANDEFAIKVLDRFSDYMGLALSHLACTVDPAVFIIGGGMSKAGDIVIDAIKKGYAKYAFLVTKDTDIKQAELKNDAGMYGAVWSLLTNVTDNHCTDNNDNTNN